jgi:tRNA threonylcarbamoyladenosine biosynthesis protein TsaB
MLLLAADTSGKHGSIALALCRPETACSVIEVVPLDGGTFSAQLVPQIAGLLAKHGHTKQHIDAFSVVSGPGSFTGLRIGLAAIKALAEVLAKPVAAVSMLEAIALSGRSRGKVIAAMDAGRGEVYAGEYHVRDGEACWEGERLLTRSELTQSAAGAVIVTADRSLADAFRDAALPVEEIELPRSGVIARLGWQKIVAGKTVSPAELDANYIRRSSEIFSKGSSQC